MRNTDRVLSHTHQHQFGFSGNHWRYFSYKLFLVQVKQGLALCFLLCDCKLMFSGFCGELRESSCQQPRSMLCSRAPWAKAKELLTAAALWMKVTSDLCLKQIGKQTHYSVAKTAADFPKFFIFFCQFLSELPIFKLTTHETPPHEWWSSQLGPTDLWQLSPLGEQFPNTVMVFFNTASRWNMVPFIEKQLINQGIIKGVASSRTAKKRFCGL